MARLATPWEELSRPVSVAEQVHVSRCHWDPQPLRNMTALAMVSLWVGPSATQRTRNLIPCRRHTKILNTLVYACYPLKRNSLHILRPCTGGFSHLCSGEESAGAKLLNARTGIENEAHTSESEVCEGTRTRAYCPDHFSWMVYNLTLRARKYAAIRLHEVIHDQQVRCSGGVYDRCALARWCVTNCCNMICHGVLVLAHDNSSICPYSDGGTLPSESVLYDNGIYSRYIMSNLQPEGGLRLGQNSSSPRLSPGNVSADLVRYCVPSKIFLAGISCVILQTCRSRWSPPVNVRKQMLERQQKRSCNC